MTRSARLERSLIAVTGADARPFLQNLLTQDLDRLGVRDVQYGALLTPQGKIVTDIMIWDDGESLILEVDRTRGADLLRRLTMYKLRSQVALEYLSEVSTIWHPVAFIGASPDPRFEALGWRSMPETGAHPANGVEFDTLRIALGVPDLARDAAPEEVFAGEALLEELNGVAFNKGCFVGQENVSRMKRRATTRKKFCPVVFEGDNIAFGTPVLAGEVELGSVRTGLAGRAIALLRLDRALEAASAGKTLTAAGREIQLDPPPWLILPQGPE